MIDTNELALLEVTPPGMGPVVRALKKKANVDNPYAVAWSMYGENGKKKKKAKDEAMSLSSAPAVLRGTKKQSYQSARHIYEAVEVIQAREAAEGSAKEGCIAKVILITEGLGNLRDKNYYGPEAIQSAPAIFEGKPMMVDHPSYSEEKDIPEGRINKTVGYYKNLRVEKMADGRLACVGECHFDLSEEGMNAFQKSRTAVHYKEDFPRSDQEYVGISVNAEGESEPRKMLINGQEMDVNYVMRFVGARSADMVTIPARGGAFVATVESIAGARMKNKEVRMKTVERLQTAQAALKEAKKLEDPELRAKKVIEAEKAIESLLKDILEATAKGKKSEAKKEDEAEDGESIETDPDSLSSEDEGEDGERGAMCGEDEDAADGDDGDDGDGADAGDSHTTVTHKVVKKTGKAALQKQDESHREAHRLAIKQLISESGINPKYFNEGKLLRLSIKEAREYIADKKREHAVLAEEMIEKFGLEVTPAHRSRESGTTREAGELEATNNAEFPKLSVI